jgi:hypothetical protein
MLHAGNFGQIALQRFFELPAVFLVQSGQVTPREGLSLCQALFIGAPAAT